MLKKTSHDPLLSPCSSLKQTHRQTDRPSFSCTNRRWATSPFLVTVAQLSGAQDATWELGMQDSLQREWGWGEVLGGESQGEVQGLPQPSHMMVTVGSAALRDCKNMKERRLCVERLHSFKLSHFLRRVVAGCDSPASCSPTCGCRKLLCPPVKHVLKLTGRKATPAFLFQLYCRAISQCFHACGSGTTYWEL